MSGQHAWLFSAVVALQVDFPESTCCTTTEVLFLAYTGMGFPTQVYATIKTNKRACLDERTNECCDDWRGWVVGATGGASVQANHVTQTNKGIDARSGRG